MLSLYPRLTTSSADGDGDDAGVDGYRVLYGIVVVCISIILFCVLAATVTTVVKACAFAAGAALVLSVAGCLAPMSTWDRRRRGRPASAVLALTDGARERPADAPPAFTYGVGTLESEGGGKQAAVSCVMCSVCIEDVHGGEMVRQLPACRHVFHVECIDMWLHSRRTCPMCRCVTAPLPMTTAKAAAPQQLPMSPDESLPPV